MLANSPINAADFSPRVISTPLACPHFWHRLLDRSGNIFGIQTTAGSMNEPQTATPVSNDSLAERLARSTMLPATIGIQ